MNSGGVSSDEAGRRSQIGALLGAIWLVSMVISFVVVQLARVQLPMAEWPSKLIGLLVS